MYSYVNNDYNKLNIYKYIFHYTTGYFFLYDPAQLHWLLHFHLFNAVLPVTCSMFYTELS